jgi:hypothetical protein
MNTLEFKQEMQRFLQAEQLHKVLVQNQLWSFLMYLMADLGKQIRKNHVSL